MKITANNYQEFLLDYFEGNLSKEEIDMLHKLARENSNIREELENFEEIPLTPPPIELNIKNSLYRTDNEGTELNNAEYLIVKHLEEGLTPYEEKILSHEYKSEKAKEREIAIMKMAKLQPGEETFQLKSKVKRVLVIRLSVSTARKAAAIAILLIATTISLWFANDMNISKEPLVAKVEKTENIKPIISNKTSEKESNTSDREHNTQKSTTSSEKTEKTITNSNQEIDNKEINTETIINKEDEQQKNIDLQPMQPLTAMAATVTSDEQDINAYEIGVNHMMPLYIAMLNNKPSEATAQENTTPRRLTLLEGGIKVFNLISGRDYRMEICEDKDGNVTEYNLITENRIINRQIRR